jgi:hypothetical protein
VRNAIFMPKCSTHRTISELYAVNVYSIWLGGVYFGILGHQENTFRCLSARIAPYGPMFLYSSLVNVPRVRAV